MLNIWRESFISYNEYGWIESNRKVKKNKKEQKQFVIFFYKGGKQKVKYMSQGFFFTM